MMLWDGFQAMSDSQQQLFNDYAANYEAALQEGLSSTGEDSSYYARGRVKWMQRWLDTLGITPRRILDFGCGTGGSTPFLLELEGVQEIVGVDVSDSSLAIARSRFTDPRVRFALTDAIPESGDFDLAFCNGVFHHIDPTLRAGCVHAVRRAVGHGGLFALWENNPWNPGTRYVMSKVSFDKDAITLSPPETRRMLRVNGFNIVASDFLFYFPRSLSVLRFIEPALCKLPLGGQYLTLATPQE